ncbi:S8 family serine peptidase [Flavobacterium luteum]|uniref:S8 family serine peptidase n=1 Tax=Flavobacterium luteum TaxID=2026654 RepID=A0A7J5AD78_9FLAO|nr:S8 family serine peptidase [Flavobacterium luteum]KAB1155537.1 S8 family serine peptidase [Flavobacterium luteum]
MKKIALFILLFLNSSVFSQEDAWVYFNSKPDSQAYFENPLTMLTQRALDRRKLQNIPIDFIDVPIYQSFINQVAATQGIKVMAKSKWFNAIHVQGLQSDIQALKTLNFVERIDFANKNLNATGKVTAPKRIKKISKTYETESFFNYASSANQIQMLNGILLHKQNYTGSGKIIAVMDAGFPGVNSAETFERLRNNNQLLGGYDYVKRNIDFYSGDSHGTLVLSTMGGFLENQLVGTAPDASYYLFVTEDDKNESPLELSLWVEAAEEADRLGVDIITTSLGYTQFDNPNYDFTYNDMNGSSTFISKGVEFAFSRGIVCVVSAGNQGSKAWRYISAPADAFHALTVGAVDAAGNYASFSSKGPSYDGRVKPDIVAQGQQSVLSNTAGAITTANGTSFSGPIIAGMVASLWQALPNKTNTEILDLIKQSSSLFTSPNEKLGHGIPDFNLALNNALGQKQFSQKEFILYPNPAQDNILISFPNGFENATITLYNSLGQKIFDKVISKENKSIFLENLNSGIYFYNLTSKTYLQSGKIVKQ